MSRYAGVKNNSIYVVSDSMFSSDGLNIINIPSELDYLSPKELINEYKIKNNEIVLHDTHIHIKKLRVAFVSNYLMHCGLSTYAENLFPEIIKHICDYRLFVEDSVSIENKHILNNKMIACWKRGEPLTELIAQIKSYEPDIILLNHEWGLFPDAKIMLSFLTQISEYRTIVIMHSIFPKHFDKLIVEASMKEIIVHLDGAKKCFVNEKKISGKVYVIPHGCYENRNLPKLWNMYKSNNTFIQVGFGLRYKAFEDSIKAVSLLKNKYKDVFFTAIFSESPFAKIEHQLYYNELIELIEKLDIKDNVGIIRGFQSEICLDAYFRTNKAAVFPYKSHPEHEVFGASGAARLAMSKGLPVITSSINHFSDLNTIKADTPEQIANELDKLFSNSNTMSEQIKKQNEFITENSWEKIALKYIEVFEAKSD